MRNATWHFFIILKPMADQFVTRIFNKQFQA